MKEAYGGEKDWSLTDRLKIEAPWSSIWRRVAEWTYGIQNTTIARVARYTPQNISLEPNNEWLNQTAIINIKKSGWVSHSDFDEIRLYAQNDKYELKRQLEIEDPDIIICGYTMGILNELYDYSIRDDENRGDNWYYFSDVIGSRERLIIDYYHPANQYPALINYYGIIGIYQQALLSKLE